MSFLILNKTMVKTNFPLVEAVILKFVLYIIL